MVGVIVVNKISNVFYLSIVLITFDTTSWTCFRGSAWVNSQAIQFKLNCTSGRMVCLLFFQRFSRSIDSSVLCCTVLLFMGFRSEVSDCVKEGFVCLEIFRNSTLPLNMNKLLAQKDKDTNCKCSCFTMLEIRCGY